MINFICFNSHGCTIILALGLWDHHGGRHFRLGFTFDDVFLTSRQTLLIAVTSFTQILVTLPQPNTSREHFAHFTTTYIIIIHGLLKLVVITSESEKTRPLSRMLVDKKKHLKKNIWKHLMTIQLLIRVLSGNTTCDKGFSQKVSCQVEESFSIFSGNREGILSEQLT